MDKSVAVTHEEARTRFLAEPSKCYQRHVRELWEEKEPREKLTSLKGAIVEEVTNEEASSIILKYEWLQKMGSGTSFCYGLKLNGELLGVVCFNKGVQHQARRICRNPDVYAKTIGLCRGACVPHAPKDSGSFLVRHACRMAFKEKGYEVFFAYSDPTAGEIGTIYQAVGWKCLGSGTGRDHHAKVNGRTFHTDFVDSTGRVYKTYSIYKEAVKRGWTKESGLSKRAYLRLLGFRDVHTPDKTKWVWFEGPRKKELEADCRFPFVEYPKRQQA